ncbi:abortive infection family protein [Schaalia sp. HMT-877]|nr:abortive infection family protein [Schaalia sp. HMT-877]
MITVLMRRKMDKSPNDFELLAQRNIIDVLIGDTPLVDRAPEVKMPYQTGRMLAALSNKYGLPTDYREAAKSRWMYMEDLLRHCVAKGSVQVLLAELFSPTHFSKMSSGKSAENVRLEHERIVRPAIEAINRLLACGGKELATVGEKYVIRPIGKAVPIGVPSIERIDREYVRNLAKRAYADVDNGDFDSALTKSRTLLEEIFCYVIEQSGKQHENKGNIGKLFEQVRNLYNMHAGADVDKRINEMVSGLNKVVSGLGGLRNTQSDAHGVGEKRMAISSRHAQLAVNAAATVAEFILQVAAHKNSL